MRIWLVQRAESTPHDDGGDRRLLRIGILADILQDQGHEVVWWTSSFDHVGKKKRYQQSTRVIVKKNYYIQYLKCFGYKKNISLSRFIDNQVVSKQFNKVAKEDKKKPDIILTSVPSIELSQMVLKYAKKNKIPVVLDIRDLWPDVFTELLPKSLSWLVNILTIPMRKKLVDICSNATAISGITDDFVKWGIRHSKRERNDKDIYFPMAYIKAELSNEKKLEANSFWTNHGVENKNTLNIVFIGTFTNSFEFDTIFSAAKILQNQKVPARFIFCGIGAKEKEIKKSCESLNNCIFAGWINAAQIKTILELSDVGLAPYINTENYIDNIPNKPAEYLSESLVIATTLTKGKLHELIYKKNCGFSYGNNPEKLASSIKHLASDKQYLKKMIINSDESFHSELDGKKIYSNMIDFLEEIAFENSI